MQNKEVKYSDLAILYFNRGHVFDEGGFCIHCGFDNGNYWWWRRHTEEGRNSTEDMPMCPSYKQNIKAIR